MSKKVILENELVKAEICTLGAELYSLIRKSDSREYIWNGDGKYWGRHAPVLFPFVGSVKDKKYTYSGKEYQMGQHGFARDMEFEVLSEAYDEVKLVLLSNEDTKARYPFDWELYITYRLKGCSLLTEWKVVNTDDKTLYFSIGGHPAFLCPKDDKGRVSLDNGAMLYFNDLKELKYKLINENGQVKDTEIHTRKLEGGFLKLSNEMFDKDALIVEDGSVRSVEICNAARKAELTIEFHAPLFGIWSPAGKKAPFLCIEPWYGRADGEDFNGTLEERKFGNLLQAGAAFTGGYSITLER